MAKIYQVFCDRCGKPVQFSDERIADLIASKYPKKDICQECCELADLGSLLGEMAVVEGKTPQQLAADLLKLYEDPE